MNISITSMGADTITASSPTAIYPRQRIAQNYLLLWLDTNIDESTKDYQNTVAQLRSVVNDVNIFTKQDEAIDFLTEVHEIKAFLIVEDNTARNILPLIHDIPQLDAIYIFCSNPSGHEQWTKEWVKVRGVHMDIKLICEGLQLGANQCNQDCIAMSFVTMDEAVSNVNLNQLEPSFMYTQIFKEILLEMDHDQQSIKVLTNYCRTLFNGNIKELNIINEFEHDYGPNSSIWWYTRECFTYQMLNRALRTLESDTIINMGFFIRDLHKQIQELHQKQTDTYHRASFTVYRGQGLSIVDFEKLQKTKGGLMSFNNFLSTSKSRDVSFRFAENASKRPDVVGILFRMSIDPSISSTPFASIREISYHRKEEEILFSMHTVFRVGEMSKINNNTSLYQVDLQLTADDDRQLRTLTEYIRKEVGNDTGWKRLGHLLLRLDQFDKAEELYNVMLEQTTNSGEKASCYHQLGYIKNEQGNYEKAIGNYEQALEIFEKTLPANHHSWATSYNNIGLLYGNMGEYSKALSFHEKAFAIRQKTLPANHPELATSYINIAAVYVNMREYSKALSFYEKALEMFEKTLPANHPSLATSYNNIGLVYNSMGEYSKAFSFHEKALEIRQKTLPANHPSLAISYNNIALVYGNMGEYSKAFSFHEKALEILKKTFPANHPLLATSYDNIAGVYGNMGEYSKALSFHEKALEIGQKALPANHPDLATSYSNIALVYINMGEYSKALSYSEQALEIFRSSLPANHPTIKIAQDNVELVKEKLLLNI